MLSIRSSVLLTLISVSLTTAHLSGTQADFPPDFSRVLGELNRLQSQAQLSQGESQLQISIDSLFQNGMDSGTATGLLELVKDMQAGALDVNVSETCLNRTEKYLGGIMKSQPWALKMFDATAKLPSGVLDGKFRWLGSYSECLAVEADVQYNGTNPDNTTWVTNDHFTGQYCSSNTPLKLGGTPLTLSVGLCVPSGCDEHDVKGLINTLLSVLRVNSTTFEKTYAICVKQDRPWTSGAIAALCVTGIIVLCILLGTAYDILYQQTQGFHEPLIPYASDKKIVANGSATAVVDEQTPLIHSDKVHPHAAYQPVHSTFHKVVVAFSIYTNGAKVLNTKQASGALTCVNGIRFLSISWVVLGHTYVFGMYVFDNTGTVYSEYLKRWTFQVLLNGTLSVDSFFLLSGLLVTYLTMKEMKKGTGKFRINWGLYYFHRFWRLTPPYMLVMMLYVPTIYYWTNGPLWPITVEAFDPYCGSNWWTNLFYVNNLVNSKEMCMGWSWYLANDMQFFVISPLILLPLFWNELIGMVILLSCLLGCLITAGTISNVNKLAIGVADTVSFDIFYIKPWTRIGPYLIGILVGYILYRTECKPKLNRLAALLGWVVATATGLALVYGLYDTFQGHPANNDVSALYNAVSRTAWGACVGWVIYACCTGYGGFVNTLLSWKAFVPLSRLTYCVYLIHPIFMYLIYFGGETLVHVTDLTMIYYFFGHMVASFACAFVVSMAFEAPMMGLEKAILQRDKSV